VRPISDITRIKRSGGMAQVAEHCLTSTKPLNSNLHTIKKKKKKGYSKKRMWISYENTI
jgi:hypothetical protein